MNGCIRYNGRLLNLICGNKRKLYYIVYNYTQVLVWNRGGYKIRQFGLD